VGQRGSQAVEIVRMGNRQWLEEDGAQRGENRCCGPDAEGECGDRRERESRRAAEGAERHADVLENGFHSWTPDRAALRVGPAKRGRLLILGRPGNSATEWWRTAIRRG